MILIQLEIKITTTSVFQSLKHFTRRIDVLSDSGKEENEQIAKKRTKKPEKPGIIKKIR